jgi:hypothetical protein
MEANAQRDRRTDIAKLTVALCNFANAPKNHTATANHVSVYRRKGILKQRGGIVYTCLHTKQTVRPNMSFV